MDVTVTIKSPGKPFATGETVTVEVVDAPPAEHASIVRNCTAAAMEAYTASQPMLMEAYTAAHPMLMVGPPPGEPHEEWVVLTREDGCYGPFPTHAAARRWKAYSDLVLQLFHPAARDWPEENVPTLGEPSGGTIPADHPMYEQPDA